MISLNNYKPNVANNYVYNIFFNKDSQIFVITPKNREDKFEVALHH